MIRKGTYILEIALGTDSDIRVGSLGELRFSRGTYCYVGSAMGGLDQRLRRHLSREKALKWHADYLTSSADSVEAYISYPDFIPECELASLAEGYGMHPTHKGFGCSDCRCRTHLFETDHRTVQAFCKEYGLTPFDAGFQ